MMTNRIDPRQTFSVEEGVLASLTWVLISR